MVSAEQSPESIDDPIEKLAVLLEQWHIKPGRDARWLQCFCGALEEREPAAWARYQRVAGLGVGMAALLGLSPSSSAAIRGAALLSAIVHTATSSPAGSRSGKADLRRAEGQLRQWRWLKACDDVLGGLRPGYDDSQPLSRHSKQWPIESRVLALAEDFDDLLAGRKGAPRVTLPEALHALRAGSWRNHDPQLVDLLWSEAGQAACVELLRHPAASLESAFADLKTSLRLLDRDWSVPVPKAGRRMTTDKKAPIASEPASENKSPRAREDVERSEEMSWTTAKQTGNVNRREDSAVEGSLPAQIASAIHEMEEIQAAATRGLEALAGVAPALEELSDLVFRLQTRVQWVQNGGATTRPTKEPGVSQSVNLRVERPGGLLDAAEVVSILETMRDLRSLRVRDQGPSWAVLQAETDPDADPAILEGKAAGLVTRHLGGNDEDEPIKVTFFDME